MSRVFLATETALGREVVVKVLAAELAAGVSAERFTRETTTAARLQQANIVPLLSAGEAGGLAYYTMPYVRGESLRTRMTSGAPLTLPERVTILRDVARALAYAHGEGVVHRDIKPENVLLSHGAAMVTDFGIAKAITASRTQDGATSGTLTQAGGSIGTPAYMAPEQAAGERVDHRTDLYAWGVMAYELLSGAHPFARYVTAQQLIAAHITESPKPLARRIPPTLAAMVMQSLEKDPTRRPASATEILAMLDTVTTPAGAGDRGWPKARSRSRAAALVVAALVVASVAVWAVRHRAVPTGAGHGAEQSLAVLPLANLSGNKADDYFGIGLAEEITRALAQSGVRVIGRVSAAALQAKGMDELAIARELHVGSLLTGAVQRAQGKVRINVSLVSAADGSVRWTETYDRPLANVFAVQDEIARTVASRLLGPLGHSSTTPVARTETTDPEAHALFLQGRVLFNRRGAGPLKQAIALFEQASARDPKYARARASLAMALAVLPAYVEDSTPECAASAITAAERAIAIDSMIPESYAALGYAHLLLGDVRRADAEFRRSISLDSSFATTWGWYGLVAGRVGEFKTAHERVARARALEPASLIARIWEAQILLPERRLAEADSVAGTAIAMDSTFLLAWQGRENALLEMGQAAKGVALLERHVALLPPGRSQEAHGMLAYGYALLGRTRDARAWLDTIRVRSGGRLPATGAIAATLDALGDHEAALKSLTDADARHDPWLVQFPRQKRYDQLRKDPRAGVILSRLGTR